MWRDSRYYLLRLRICFLGRNETVVIQHQKKVHVLGPLLPAGFGADNEEGASVDIVTFLGEMLVQHGKWSVFLVKILSFSSGFQTILIISPQVSFGTLNWPSVSEYVDEPWLKRKHHLYVNDSFSIQQWILIMIRFLLLHLHVPKYRSNRQNESNYQVWEY
jgi:hypothetical protein